MRRYYHSKRLPLPHRPSRPQGSKKGKRGYSRAAEKHKLFNLIRRRELS